MNSAYRRASSSPLGLIVPSTYFQVGITFLITPVDLFSQVRRSRLNARHNVNPTMHDSAFQTTTAIQ
jgi:hypothetical protein